MTVIVALGGSIVHPGEIDIAFLKKFKAFIAPFLRRRVKFVLVIAMSGLHGMFAATVKRFGRDANTRPQRFYRIINEVPMLLVIGIVILVIVKPF